MQPTALLFDRCHSDDEQSVIIMYNYRKNIEKHNCKLGLDDDSDSGLPKQDPGAGVYRKTLRAIRKVFLASFQNTRAHLYIKSQPALLAERKKHVRGRSWFVIHPLSTFTMYREMFMMTFWLTYLIVEPFLIAFTPDMLQALGIVQIIFLLDIVINFIHGYIDPKTLEIILDFKLVVKRYIFSYFIFDLLSYIILPTCLLCTGTYTGPEMIAAENCSRWAIIQSIIRMPRMLTAFEYLSELMDFFGLGRLLYTCLIIVINTFVFLHHSACTIFNVAFFLSTRENARDTFIHMAGLIYEKSISVRYECCFLQACTLFFRCNLGYFQVLLMEEKVTQFFILLLGHFYFAYIICLVYDMVAVSTNVGNKFEEVWTQIEAYMLQKNLPKHLRKRISVYYNYRFEKKFFRETAILETLSEHLKYEIILFTCMPLIQKAVFFEKFPKALIGKLITCLVREVYLYNDVIFKVGDKAAKMYFIYTGTVAMYNINGEEYHHYYDGDNFGEARIEDEREREHSSVSVEISELYTLKYSDLKRHLNRYPQLWSQMRVSNRKKFEIMKQVNTKPSNSTSRTIEDTLAYL